PPRPGQCRCPDPLRPGLVYEPGPGGAGDPGAATRRGGGALMRDLSGKAALVTGGGSGIGRGTVLALAAAGTRVAVADIDAGRADEVAREGAARGVDCVAVPLDVNRERDFEMARDAMLERFGRVDIVMNNVGL